MSFGTDAPLLCSRRTSSEEGNWFRPQLAIPTPLQTDRSCRLPIMCHNGPLSIHASRTTDCLVDVKTAGIVIEDGAKAVSISLGQPPRRVSPSGEDPRLYFSSFR